MTTRAEAIETVKAKTLARWSNEHPGWLWPPGLNESMFQFFDGLEALGLIKFDERITDKQEALDRIVSTMTEVRNKTNPEFVGCPTPYGAGCILDSLEAAGFEIRRRA